MRSIRWPIAILLAVATAVGYLDRQTLTLTWKAIQQSIPLSHNDFGTLQALFYLAYALMYVGGGWLMDFLGTRRAFLLIVVWWSLACAGHGLARGFLMLAAARLMLGLAQGGLFPGGAKAVAEWFPARERGTAMGMMNAGSSVGAVIAPPAVALVLWYAPWPWVYYLCGAMGLFWAAWWLWDYYPPAQHPRLSAEERHKIAEVMVSAPRRQSGVSWWRLLLVREVWGLVLSKACCDAVWFTYIAWVPKYLVDIHGFDATHVGTIGWIPFAASGVGSVFGGWCSGRLLRRGYSLSFARKAVLGASAALMPCMCLVAHVPMHADIALISIAFFAHLSFSTLVFTLATDLFPRGMVGTVAGLVGFGSAMGGMAFNKFAGCLIQSLKPAAGYPMLFAIGSTFHIVGFLLILLMIRKVGPLARYAESGD